MTLDIATLYVVSVLTTVFAGCLFLYTYQQSRATLAVFWWGIALLLAACGGVVLALEAFIPPLAVHLVGNSLVILAYGLIWHAARLFEYRQPNWIATFSGTGIWLLACTLPGLANEMTGKGIATAVTLSLYMFATASEIARGHAEPLVSRKLATIVMTTYGVLLACYVPLILTFGTGAPGVPVASPAFGFMMLGCYLLWFAVLFLLLTLVKERGELHHRVAALVDPLTGSGNRRYFMQECVGALEKCRHSGRPSSVLIADLDHFKSVNDGFGHAAGDSVLKLFSATAHAHLDAGQVFGRLGGEEFGIFLPGLGEKEAGATADRIRRAFAAAAQLVDGFPIASRVSIGGCVAPYSAQSVNDLLAGADAALYEAKNKGRNRVEIKNFGDMNVALDIMLRRNRPAGSFEVA